MLMYTRVDKTTALPEHGCALPTTAEVAGIVQGATSACRDLLTYIWTDRVAVFRIPPQSPTNHLPPTMSNRNAPDAPVAGGEPPNENLDSRALSLAIFIFSVSTLAHVYLSDAFSGGSKKDDSASSVKDTPSLKDTGYFRFWMIFNVASLYLAMCVVLIEATHLSPLIPVVIKRWIKYIGDWTLWVSGVCMLVAFQLILRGYSLLGKNKEADIVTGVGFWVCLVFTALMILLKVGGFLWYLV
ncbi:hypothetical protein L2E82_14760 [Cichorium intybus]|uniref:Uncharacterized protein n=2 Tax=Cichorium intybus TaxID=13427 RepID=A0ACB9F1H0_CICIN|nr:hypothetical protein L2E82_14757 [Cichorium intybus]KAI3764746.1 hypothetical protein L2E82_14760 [Cichorium intybus]